MSAGGGGARVKAVGVTTLVLLALAAGAYAFTFGALRADGPREIVVIAKDMAFTSPDPQGGAPPAAAASGETPGPTIVLRAGERVRIVLRNQDPGMRHDLVADHLGLRTEALDHGESDSLDLRVPNEASEGDYYCSFHSRLMRGRIVVR